MCITSRPESPRESESPRTRYKIMITVFFNALLVPHSHLHGLCRGRCGLPSKYPGTAHSANMNQINHYSRPLHPSYFTPAGLRADQVESSGVSR